uniref:HAD-IIB family hydrolase n=1 Tax=Paenibacillus dakarensis TaxID=1527293 RepID=UPI0006D56C01
GQYVVYQGEVIYKNPMQLEVIESLTDYAVRSDQPILYVSEEHMRVNVVQHVRIESSYGPLKMELPEYDPDYYKNRDIYQAIVFCTNEEQALYEKEYERLLRFVRWDTVATDVLPLGCSKAAGIEYMIKHLGKDAKEVIAFGDHLNDIEMLSYVGHGVAMGNAQPEVKKVAKYITSDVDQDGIMMGLHQLGLISLKNTAV